MIKNKKGKFTAELRQFAVTLQFYSAKAYDFVRSTFKNVLPHPKSISRWYKVINGKPGFSQEALHAISLKSANENVAINLTVDEMAVKKNVTWTGSEWSGFVNMGTEIGYDGDERDRPLATNILVFMAVAINSHWKIPVGYFAINGLNGEERANLLTKCIILLHETNSHLHSITYDGTSVNKTMCIKLGANFSPKNMKAYIDHPITQQPIYLIWDAAHMMKLVRNCFGEKQKIYNSKGECIDWNFIRMLHEKQKDQGLHLATKLTNRHIHYHNEKMRVKLAVQVLSESVNSALKYLHNTDSDYKNALATAEFCEYFNRAFDILNSRSKFSKAPYGKPLSLKTIEKYEQFTEQFKTYVMGLTLKEVTKKLGSTIFKEINIVNHSRNTGFVGLILDLENCIQIYKTLDDKQLLNHGYMLTYKCSQDHLETFFSAVRGRNGFNNNPSCFQFEHAYKRLLVNNQITASCFGNCGILDATTILPLEFNTTDNITEGSSKELTDHDYIESSVSLSSYVEDVVEYIAGFIVKKVKQRIDCSFCKNILIQKNPNRTIQFVQFKQWDGCNLINPSKDVILICKYAEAYMDVFQNIEDHTSNQCVFNNHREQLINLIIDLFLKVRLRHIGTRINDDVFKSSFRQKFTKLVTHMNQ